jgi:hypothetical protein
MGRLENARQKYLVFGKLRLKASAGRRRNHGAPLRLAVIAGVVKKPL